MQCLQCQHENASGRQVLQSMCGIIYPVSSACGYENAAAANFLINVARAYSLYICTWLAQIMQQKAASESRLQA